MDEELVPADQRNFYWILVPTIFPLEQDVDFSTGTRKRFSIFQYFFIEQYGINSYLRIIYRTADSEYGSLKAPAAHGRCYILIDY